MKTMFSKFTTVIRAASLPSFSFSLSVLIDSFVFSNSLQRIHRSTDIGRYFFSRRDISPSSLAAFIPGLRRKIVKAAIIFNVKIVCNYRDDDRSQRRRVACTFCYVKLNNDTDRDTIIKNKSK